jgi:pimeloyl-ACP methyl ester carboxylesterase
MPTQTSPHTPASPKRQKRRIGLHFIITASLLLGLVAYVVAMAGLYFKQEALLFKPEPLAASQPLQGLTTQGEGVSEFTVAVPGAKLSGLQLKLPNPKGVVFFLHGNRGNLDEWFVNTGIYRRNNMDLVMVDYRGFGKSTGQIESETQLRSDVRAAWDQMAPQYAGKKRVIYGRSLGSGLAAGLSADLEREKTPSDLTVLVSPYSSMSTLTAQIYPYVPQAVLRYPLRTDKVITQIKSPLLLLHGDQDKLIPLSHSKSLKALSPQAQLLIVNGAAHSDIHKFEAYLQGFGAMLAGL